MIKAPPPAYWDVLAAQTALEKLLAADLAVTTKLLAAGRDMLERGHRLLADPIFRSRRGTCLPSLRSAGLGGRWWFDAW
jgi:hypothetical protein